MSDACRPCGVAADTLPIIGMLIERFPRLRLDPGVEPVYRGHEYRSPKSLRVLVE